MASTAAVLQILVTANARQAQATLATTSKQLDATGAKAGKASKALAAVGKVGAVGLAVGVGFAVKKAADFEQQLDSLASVSGATGKEMERLRKQAMKAGADTKFSALEAAKAQTELAKGGLAVAQISKGGLKSALALAAAGELDLAEAAETTANALNLFGLRGKESMKVADALATAANATTADVSDFAMALKQGGAVAKSAGLSFSQTVLALEALAKSGVRNADAGTSLKTALIQLLKPTDKQAELAKKLGLSFIDAHGNMKSMADISGMLRGKLDGQTKAQRTATLATLAGTDGVRTLTALYDAGPKKLDAWEKGLNKSGTAAKVAAEKQDNLKGKLENLQGSVETMAIAFGSKAIPVLSTFAEKVTSILGDKKLTNTEKFARFAELLSDAFDKGLSAIAQAASQYGPKIASALGSGMVRAWYQANPLGKMLGVAAILRLVGGKGAITAAGASIGRLLGVGVASGAATAAAGGGAAGAGAGAAGGLLGSMRAKLLPMAGRVGLAGVGVALADKLISDMGQRATAKSGDLFKAITAKTADPSKILGLGIEDIFGKSDTTVQGEKLVATLKGIKDEARAISPQRAIELKNELRAIGGVSAPALAAFNALVNGAVNKGRQIALIRNEFGRLRHGAVIDIQAINSTVASNFQKIKDVMGVKTAAGRQAVQENFSAGLSAIKRSMADGTVSTRQGMLAMVKLLRLQSGLGKAAIGKNYGAIEAQIQRTMSRGGKLTEEGMRFMREVMVNEMKDLGLSSDSIRMSLNKKASAKKGFTQPGQTGLVVSGGKPTGDSVHALLERGEVVINRKAVAAMGGPHAVNAINTAIPRFQSGGVPGFAKGGIPRVSIASNNPGGALPKVGNRELDIFHGAAQKKLDRGKARAASRGVGGGESSTTGLVPQVRRALAWARKHGWSGSVTSGFRSRAEQAALYARYLAGGNLAAPPGSSNHERGRAVDVSDPAGFARAMASAPPNARLINLPAEAWHYSVDGHRRGGIIGKVLRMRRGGAVTAARAAYGAGFRGGTLMKMLMISGRETGGTYDPGSTNINARTRDHSIGLWQINQLAHHGRFGTDAQLKNPARNARAAWKLYKERGLEPWHGMVNTARFRGAAQRAIAALKKGGSPKKGAKRGSGGGILGSKGLSTEQLFANRKAVTGRRVVEPIRKGTSYAGNRAPRPITAMDLSGDVGGSDRPSGPSPAEQLAEAMKTLGEQVAGLKAETAERNRITSSTLAIGLREAERALADMISGQLGTSGAQRGRTPGTGQLARW